MPTRSDRRAWVARMVARSRRDTHRIDYTTFERVPGRRPRGADPPRTARSGRYERNIRWSMLCSLIAPLTIKSLGPSTTVRRIERGSLQTTSEREQLGLRVRPAGTGPQPLALHFRAFSHPRLVTDRYLHNSQVSKSRRTTRHHNTPILEIAFQLFHISRVHTRHYH